MDPRDRALEKVYEKMAMDARFGHKWGFNRDGPVYDPHLKRYMTPGGELVKSCQRCGLVGWANPLDRLLIALGICKVGGWKGKPIAVEQR